MWHKKTNIVRSIDWVTVILYLILVVGGWFSVYAATYSYDHGSAIYFSSRAGMQMIWIFSSLLIAFVLLLIDSDWYDIFAIWIYLAIVALLIVTVFIAPDIRGSRSWLIMGPVHIQPAEFAKFATALIVAKVISAYHFRMMKPQSLLTIAGFILLPMSLILLQQELGSSLVFLAFFLVLYREGMSGAVLFSGSAAALFFILAIRYSDAMWYATEIGKFSGFVCTLLFTIGLSYNYSKGRKNINSIVYVALGVCLVAGIACLFPFAPFDWSWIILLLIAFTVVFLFVLFVKSKVSAYLWIILFAIASVGFIHSVEYVFENVLDSHQKIRIEVALGTVDDPSGAGYNVNQSKIAIGSGGLLGKGYLNGTQTKLKYVPEQDTDFIFCTIGEEMGFVGSVSVLILFLFLIIRIIHLAERQRSAFRRVYGYSVASIFFFHLAVNIGMVIGIVPVIGIPLPFFSYGGSSLLGFTILLFIFLRLDASRGDRA